MSYYKNAIQSLFPSNVDVKCTEDFNEHTVRAEISWLDGHKFHPILFTFLKDLFGVDNNNFTFILEGHGTSDWEKSHDVTMILEVTNVTTMPIPAAPPTTGK